MSGRDFPTVEVTCEILAETAAAMKIFDYFSEEEHWIPLSQVETIVREPHSSCAVIHVAEWLAKKKGLI